MDTKYTNNVNNPFNLYRAYQTSSGANQSKISMIMDSNVQFLFSIIDDWSHSLIFFTLVERGTINAFNSLLLSYE